MKTETDNHIKAISNIIIKFLKDNGGYSNGYVTYALGRVSVDSYGSIQWSTPKSDELTGKEVNKRGRELYEVIRKYMEINEINKTLIIENHHVEHGAYYTFISFKEPKHRLSWV